ncbi:MAG: glycoside hydrolase family 71/99-like protein [Bacteroidota bacterium]|nr:glycoside hydrolase family 71/99-like protein [Bacteroidota bacterium]HHU97780.1 hypothetical protein [Petrimonas sp.]
MCKKHQFTLLKTCLLLVTTLCTLTIWGQNGKKVYADYHGVRYTRQHDGQLGRWELYANTSNSSTGIKTLCYNADLILDNGQHEIASVNYPLVGMQSNLDHDYLEYQILSAKTAKIDGFFIEWGFMHHENDQLLRVMQKVASKYDFEVGVNWCDGWLYYDWITKMYPEINSREKKTEHYIRCYQYLIDNVFTAPTAPIVKGHPVFYLFGPGATVEEFKQVTPHLAIPNNIKKPVVLRRWAEWGSLVEDKYRPITQSDEIDQWIQLGAVPTAWLPARVRPRDNEFPFWDQYATQDDLIEFMKPFRDSVWINPQKSYPLISGFVMPGMDNRGCAGWGRGHFFYIPRDKGKSYEKMWEFNLNSRDALDMIFIASWSDYTEGHEIEPTQENGNRELLTTLKYASQFKEEEADSTGLSLPLKLFQLRKLAKFLYHSRPEVDFCATALDDAARYISLQAYDKAKKVLEEAEAELNSIKKEIKTRQITITVNEDDLQKNKTDQTTTIYFDNETINLLNEHHYTGYLSFEYLDEGDNFFMVHSETDRDPKDLFSVVAKIKKDNQKCWKKAKVALYKENITYLDDTPALNIKGDVDVKNISVTYDLYK